MNDSTMPRLAELQRRFQRHLLNGDDTVASTVIGSEQVPAATRLKVYSDAYRIRLIEAIESNYPRLAKLLGKQNFSQVATEYLERYPSTYRSIRWFGDRLPQMLSDTHPTQPWVAELAMLEWAIAAAFDAIDTDVAETDVLAHVPADRWSDLRFDVHPSVQRLQLSSNAPQLFKALSADESAGEGRILQDAPSWLIWRQDQTPQYRSLNAGEAAALERMMAGASFGEICELLCQWHDETQVPLVAAGLLKGWISDGLIVRMKVM